MGDSGDPLPVDTSDGKSIVGVTASDLDSPGDVRCEDSSGPDGEFEDGRSDVSPGSNTLAIGDKCCDVNVVGCV